MNEEKLIFNPYVEKVLQGKAMIPINCMAIQKMGLLMATFKMAKEYKKHGISVNAIMIPATKISKSTIRKFESYWRIFAILQNPFLPNANVIGEAYFTICTMKRYHKVTGKLINHLGQIVQKAEQNISFLKILRGLDFYPSYAEDEETSKRIWVICKHFMKENT